MSRLAEFARDGLAVSVDLRGIYLRKELTRQRRMLIRLDRHGPGGRPT
jgi:hypothetical protein